MDVQTAFLNPDLSDDECVYMELPDGFVKQMTKYLRLRKSLYGLKQAPRAWYKEIDHYLTSIGFKASAYDPNLYLHNDGHTMLVLYVDDLLIAVAPKHRASTSSVTPDQIQSTIKKRVELLSGKYKMVDLGRPTSFLGIQIEISDNCVKILQTQYIEEVLKRFGMNDAAGVSTPMVPNSKLSKSNSNNDEFPLDQNGTIIYQSIVGSLMYAMVCTRPDRAYTLSRLSKFNANPTNVHME